jgi:hypothetical protein
MTVLLAHRPAWVWWALAVGYLLVLVVFSYIAVKEWTLWARDRRAAREAGRAPYAPKHSNAKKHRK